MSRLAVTKLKVNVKEYADIIEMKHPISQKHPQMSMHERAAQFAPFAALNGFEEMIQNTKEKYEKRQLEKKIT